MNRTVVPVARRAALQVKLAQRADEIEQALRLRYQVFVEELGNRHLYDASGIERDAYDAYCDHLIVTDADRDCVVGAYRLLPGYRVMEHIGFYSETEFDLSAFRAVKGLTLELGRSCVAPEYRNGTVIQRLWEGIADYLQLHSHRYLIGCVSLPGQDVDAVSELYSLLWKKGVVTERFGICPLASHRIAGLRQVDIAYSEKEMNRRLPPLLKGYQWLGAEIAGEPAYDPIFRTTDFFVVLETANVARRYQRHFLR
ncbi:GNAT family N-acetyltransferase [Heliobacterium gestii]|uniref:GNAT family N-acetyltransferase n=1 Tax=Heliomicrobium gestii TaxID=2699 RepID=A0A845LCA8_HELGE|nr:GNAT family N-acyltransferase [Heliomicrobium gestii]MBM7866518.1 putative hemolysin [Heliomicrobium gestii]MZP43201.1 GNAT family N-acetyltransferase [Heliomicrobium gestii]